MAYRIDPRRAADREVRRIARETLGAAIASLAEGSPQGVHDARKRLKELRALLRLVREPLGKRAFAHANATFRETGQALSASRDSAALLECWDRLAAEEPATFAAPSWQAIRARLAAQVTPPPDTAREGQPLIGRLEAAHAAIDDWPLQGEGFLLLRDGVLRSYRDGRRALAAARRTPDDEHLHEWRKRAKDHWYQTRLLRDAWPGPLKARQKALKRLADTLGDDHDLAVLGTRLQEAPALFGNAATGEALAGLIRARRHRLQRQALRLGARLYADKPAALARRWARYWAVASD